MIRIALLLLMLSWQLSPDASGAVQQLVADEGGKLLKRIDALGYETNYTYNNRGELEKVRNALDQETQMEYDLAGRLIKRTDPNGGIIRWEYDDLGRLIKTFDPLNRVTEKGYRDDGVVTSIKDAEGKITTFEYDGNGRRTALIDPNGNRTEFTYNGDNQVLTQTDPLGKVTTYAYDPQGNLSTVTDRLGRIRQFSYDANNRLTSEIWKDSQSQVVKTIAMSYNLLGRLVTAGDDTGDLDLSYDLRNRPANITTHYTGREAFVLNFAYNEVARTSSVTDGEGVSVLSEFDARQQMKKLVWQGGGIASATVKINRNDLGDMTEVLRYNDASGANLVGKTAQTYGRARTDIGYAASAYNGAGDSAGLAGFNSTETFGSLAVAPGSSDLLSQGSNPLQRITEIIHQKGDETSIQTLDYIHDASGQLTSETQSVPSVAKNFSYDPRGQLTSVSSVNSVVEQFSYDDSGNRLNANGNLYVIVASNRVETDGVNTYGYDDEGNLVGKANAIERWAYIYDHRNHLISARKFDDANTLISSVQYTYDVLDRRIQKSVYITSSPNPLITLFDYHGEHIWRETKPDGSITKYLVGEGMDQWLARYSVSGGLNWYLGDRLGSIKTITNATGLPLVNYTYSAFGQRTISGDATKADSFGFTGREHDTETSLMYYRARYYDPVLGKFTSEDPLGVKPLGKSSSCGKSIKPFAGGDYNLGRYVFNSPENFRDPNGTTATLDYGQTLSVGVTQQQALAAVFALSAWQIARAALEIEWVDFMGPPGPDCKSKCSDRFDELTQWIDRRFDGSKYTFTGKLHDLNTTLYGRCVSACNGNGIW